MTSRDFEKAKDKGEIGESIIIDFLRKKGYIPYKHDDIDKAHPFDIIAVNSNGEIGIYEVKTKARLNYYDATGIDKRHYETYKRVSAKHSLRVFLCFVDEFLKTIYGNFLDILEAPTKQQSDKRNYPMEICQPKTIMLFPLCNMIQLGEIEQQQSEKLQELSQRKYRYNITAEPIKQITPKKLDYEESKHIETLMNLARSL